MNINSTIYIAPESTNESQPQSTYGAQADKTMQSHFDRIENLSKGIYTADNASHILIHQSP